MKMRKNLFLEAGAVERGERAAAERKISLSALVEKHLLALPAPDEEEEFWPGPPLKVIPRPGDRRTAYLLKKHA